MSVLLEALKKAAEKRAEAESAKTHAGHAVPEVKGDESVSPLESPASGDLPGLKKGGVEESNASVGMVDQANEHAESRDEESRQPNVSDFPLKLKLPVDQPTHEAREESDIQEVPPHSDEVALSHSDSGSPLSDHFPHGEDIPGDGIEHTTAIEGEAAEQNDFDSEQAIALKTDESHEQQGQAQHPEETAAPSFSHKNDIKLATEGEEENITPAEEWSVPQPVRDIEPSDDEDVAFVPPSSLSEMEPPDSVERSESKAQRHDGEQLQPYGSSLEDPSILLKERPQKQWFRVNPVLILIFFILVSALGVLAWSFYQTEDRVIPPRYAHVADKYQPVVKELMSTKQEAPHDSRHTATQGAQVSVKSEDESNISKAPPHEDKVLNKRNAPEKKQLPEAVAEKGKAHTNKVTQAHTRSIQNAAHSERKVRAMRAVRLPMESRKHIQAQKRSMLGTELGAKPTSGLTVDQCFEHLVNKGGLESACQDSLPPAVDQAFSAYMEYRRGHTGHAYALIQQAYMKAPYDIYVAQIYALLAGANIPLDHLISMHDLFPSSAVIALQLANRYYATGKVAEALSVVKTALEHRPQNGYLLYNAALLALKKKDKKSALDFLARIPAYQLQSDFQLHQAVKELKRLIHP